MNKKFAWAYLLMASIAVSIAFISCQKFLEKKSNQNLVVPNSLTDLQRLLDDFDKMNAAATPSMGSSSDDDYFVPENTLNTLIPTLREVYFWQSEDLTSSNDWSVAYEKVYIANFCLETLLNITQTSSSSDEWKRIRGSALFFRAYYFLQLAWNYCHAYDKSHSATDLGIVLRLTSDFNVPSVRATVEETYSQIIADAKEAVALLPSKANIPTRPSKWAAYGLLARTYWSMRDYKNALAYADSCLKIGNALIDFNGDEEIRTTLNANTPFVLFNKETIFYSDMNRKNGLHFTNSRGRIDTALYAQFQNGDLRKTAFFSKRPDGFYMYKGNYTNSVSAMFTGIGTDEIYLIRAEAYLRTGKIKEGINDLNTLLSKRYITNTFKISDDITADEAIQTLLMERRKELIMRGQRWIDIKRQNRDGANIILRRIENGEEYKLLPGAGRYALPLPADIIRITGMPQNEK